MTGIDYPLHLALDNITKKGEERLRQIIREEVARVLLARDEHAAYLLFPGGLPPIGRTSDQPSDYESRVAVWENMIGTFLNEERWLKWDVVCQHDDDFFCEHRKAEALRRIMHLLRDYPP